MRLWEAILIGCDRRGQTVGELWDMYPDDDCIKSCALGAAYEGSLGLPDNCKFYSFTRAINELSAKFPVLNEIAPQCPECGLGHGDVVDTIVDLNDDHMWPREKIALEFVKPIEDAMEDTNEEAGS